MAFRRAVMGESNIRREQEGRPPLCRFFYLDESACKHGDEEDK